MTSHMLVQMILKCNNHDYAIMDMVGTSLDILCRFFIAYPHNMKIKNMRIIRTLSVGSILLSTVTFFIAIILSLSLLAQDLLMAFVMSPNAALLAVMSFKGLSAFLLLGTFKPSLWVFRAASCLLLVVIPWVRMPFKFSLTPIGFDANRVGAIMLLLKQLTIITCTA